MMLSISRGRNTRTMHYHTAPFESGIVYVRAVQKLRTMGTQNARPHLIGNSFRGI
jgi:hypothetical protein